MVTSPARAPADEPRRIPLWAAGAAFWAVVLAVVAARAANLGELPAVATFAVIFTSIMVEALPFVLIGALVSATVAVYVPERAFARLTRLPAAIQMPCAAAAGFAFPVCECGSVPVARRLLLRGLHPAACLTFMLAAPLLNPVVIASTWVAYGGGDRGAEMVAGRSALGLGVAVLAACVLARRGIALRPRAGTDEPAAGGPAERRASFTGHLAADFLYMGRFLALGAAAAAFLQTVVPQTLLSGLAGSTVLATIALMALAFMLSLCSEADAFVATAFTAFPLEAQLGFLLVGPVADVKLTVLYGATFRPPFVLPLLAVVAPVVLVGSLAFGVLV
jgi:uncharacterized membrane protein YraQ (UPF0718 family)